jgi:hypothetical protein
VRTKSYDTVDTYIPSVLLSREQYAKVDAVLVDANLTAKAKAEEGRRLLRDGPVRAYPRASSLASMLRSG